jgi:hypothetical protein
MIDDKKIKEAAMQHSRWLNSNHEESTASDSFMEGAKWMQEEFLKDLWHPASEEPREFAEILAEAPITESIKAYFSFKRNSALFKNWNAYSSSVNITRWLYIRDLLPKKGGE